MPARRPDKLATQQGSSSTKAVSRSGLSARDRRQLRLLKTGLDTGLSEDLYIQGEVNSEHAAQFTQETKKGEGGMNGPDGFFLDVEGASVEAGESSSSNAVDVDSKSKEDGDRIYHKKRTAPGTVRIMTMREAEEEEARSVLKQRGSTMAVLNEGHSAAVKRQEWERSRKARKETTGKKWFNMQAGELSAENKRDLELIKMRQFLDPKAFYKKSDFKGKTLPKFFEFGTIVEGMGEFKSARISKKYRQQSITDEYMRDMDFRTYAKKQFLSVQQTKGSGGKKEYKRHTKKRKPNWQR